ncbi:cation diffusion facilitator family transporter [Magnetococcales bacterium HHB-1]
MHSPHDHDHDDHDHDLSEEQKEERFKATQRITLLGALVNVILAIGKVGAGILGNSAAMVADGIHSASDLVTDGVVLITMRMAKKDADEDHPYGHGKFETLATMFIGILLLIVSIGIVGDAFERLSGDGDLTPPTTIALIAAIISIAMKEGMFHLTIGVGKKYNAKAIIANAWHQRSDAISSVAALVGIGGAMMGWPIFDPLAAVAVAFILGKVSLELLKESLMELSDSSDAVDEHVRHDIQEILDHEPEIQSYHALRFRQLGPDTLVDVHIEVSPFISVSEGHMIAEKTRAKLIKEVASVKDVVVHIDTENDMQYHDHPPPQHLPNRFTLTNEVNDHLPDYPLFASVKSLTPHYILDDGIALDIKLDLAKEASSREIQAEAKKLTRFLLEEVKEITHIRIHTLAYEENKDHPVKWD